MSFNLVNYVRAREISMQKVRKIPEMWLFLTHNLLKEYPFDQCMNTILSSQWLSDRKVIFGDCYGKLMVYKKDEVNTDRFYIVERFNTGPESLGIYSLKINFSRTLLAVGVRNGNRIVIYDVSSLNPVCVCQNFTFKVFDMVWLNDEFLVSCTANMNLVLWNIGSNLVDPSDNAAWIMIRCTEPVHVLKCNFAIREITFNKTTKEIAVLTLDNFIRTWSCTPDGSFEPKSFKELPELGRHASLAIHDDGSYAIGCSRRILFLDTRLEKIKDVPDDNVLGITSASFQGSILTMGTSMKLMFYDESLPPFIYTHCYNPSGTKVFMGGGSLEFDNGYAGIWQYKHLIRT